MIENSYTVQDSSRNKKNVFVFERPPMLENDLTPLIATYKSLNKDTNLGNITIEKNSFACNPNLGHIKSLVTSDKHTFSCAL